MVNMLKVNKQTSTWGKPAIVKSNSTVRIDRAVREAYAFKGWVDSGGVWFGWISQQAC